MNCQKLVTFLEKKPASKSGKTRCGSPNLIFSEKNRQFQIKNYFEEEKLTFFIAYLKLWVDLQKRLLRWKVIFTTQLAFLFDSGLPENFLNGL